MPKTSLQYEIETTGERVFRNTLDPQDFVVNNEFPDFGIDFKLQLVKNRIIIGDECYVQLKSTGKDLSKIDCINIPILLITFFYGLRN